MSRTLNELWMSTLLLCRIGAGSSFPASNWLRPKFKICGLELSYPYVSAFGALRRVTSLASLHFCTRSLYAGGNLRILDYFHSFCTRRRGVLLCLLALSLGFLHCKVLHWKVCERQIECFNLIVFGYVCEPLSFYGPSFQPVTIFLKSLSSVIKSVADSFFTQIHGYVEGIYINKIIIYISGSPYSRLRKRP